MEYVEKSIHGINVNLSAMDHYGQKSELHINFGSYWILRKTVQMVYCTDPWLQADVVLA